ncbi:MAG: hypothetical protein ABI273_06990 [Lacunisphaera sp.]
MVSPPKLNRLTKSTIWVWTLIVIGAVCFVAHRWIISRRAQSKEVEYLNAKIHSLEQRNAKLLARKAAQSIAEAKGVTTPVSGLPHLSSDFDADGIIERTAALKGYLADHPEKGIPELRLLRDEDWIETIGNGKLDNEADMRKALSLVEMRAKIIFGASIAVAVKDFQSANNGQLPSTITKLAPFLTHPENDDLLSAFEPATPEDSRAAPSERLFKRKPSIDEWYGSFLYVGIDMVSARPIGLGWEVERGISEYAKMHHVLPTDYSQVIPLVKNNPTPSAMSDIFSALQKSPGENPVLFESNNGGQSSIASLYLQSRSEAYAQ